MSWITSVFSSSISTLWGDTIGNNEPIIDWNFAGGVMPSALTFSRASLATMYDAAGTLVWCPHNLVRSSEDLTSANWVRRGTVSVAQVAGANPGSGGYISRVSSLNASGDDVYQSVTGVVGASMSLAIWMRRISTVGLLALQNPYGVSEGRWNINLASLSDEWELVTASHSAVSIVNAFVGAPGSGACGIHLFSASGSNLSFDVVGARVCVGALQPYYPTTSAAYYGPRLTYDPVTHSALGLLVEEQRTNLAWPSSGLGTWLNKASVTVTDGYTTAPDGTATASRIQSSGAGFLYAASMGQVSGTAYTLSAFAKRNDGGAQSFGFFKDGSGSVNSAAALTTAWQRFAYSYTAANASNYGLAASNGADVSGFGVQMEAGAFATSYIPTGAASATRAADVVTCTGAAFSQWFNGSEGTFVVEAVMPNSTVGSTNIMNLVEVRDASGNEWIKVYQYETWFGAGIRHGGVTQADISGTKTAGVVEKIAFAWAANDAAVAIRGSLVGTDATVALPTGIDRLTLGTGSTGAVACTIKRVRYWRKRLTNAQLQALTA